MDKFRDIAYTYEYDNPFENDQQRINCNKLLSFISDNSETFMLNDYINQILFKTVNPNVKGLYGKKIEKSITNNPIAEDVKSFLKDFSKSFSIPHDLKIWIGIPTTDDAEISPDAENDDSSEEEEGEDESEGNDENDSEGNGSEGNGKGSEKDVIKIDKNKFCYSMTEGITNYDISSEKLLGLSQVRELSVNIARSLLAKNIKIDYDIQKLEIKKRKDLIVQIQKYKNIKKIAALLDDDIVDMSIDQLEICLEQCKKYHETFKLQEVIKSTFNGAKVGLSCFLPNGIKIGKKRIKMEGIGDELVSTLFDSTTVIGKSFDNIAQKYNFHINDDALVLLKIGETIIKGIKIENVEDENENPSEESKSNHSKSKPEKRMKKTNFQPISRMSGTMGINDSIRNTQTNFDSGSDSEDEEEEVEEEVEEETEDENDETDSEDE